MFKIGDAETKISVTTWNGSVRVHFRKFYQSKFDRKKFYPSKQGIALTLQEWGNFKTLFTQVDEVVQCNNILLEEEKEERMEFNSNWATDCDEIMHRDKEQKKAAFERQVAVNDEDEMSNLHNFNQEVIDGIVRLSESTHQNTFRPPFVGDFDNNANSPLSFKTRLILSLMVSREETLNLYLH